MPQGRNQTHYQVPLTTMSIAYTQDSSGFIADKVFPSVSSLHKTGMYFHYSKPDFFRIKSRLRADYTTSEVTDWNVGTTGSYLIQKHAIGAYISAEDRRETDKPLDLDRDTVFNLTETLLLEKEQVFINEFIRPNIWANDIQGVDDNASLNNKTILKWSNPISNPIKDISDLKRKMLKTTGKEPNTLVLSKDVLDTLLQHENIISRIQFVQKGVLSQDLLASLLEVDRILVSKAIYDKSQEKADDTIFGNDEDMDFLMGEGVAFLAYVPPNPGLRTVSAGYTFTLSNSAIPTLGSAPAIRKFPMPEKGEGVEKIEAELAYDFKVVCKDLGIFLYNLI